MVKCDQNVVVETSEIMDLNGRFFGIFYVNIIGFVAYLFLVLYQKSVSYLFRLLRSAQSIP